MDKDVIKRFMEWLDGASLKEIEARRRQFLDTADKVTSPCAKADIRLGLRLIDEEVLARLEIGRLA